jgi:hypothetical protein
MCILKDCEHTVHMQSALIRPERRINTTTLAQIIMSMGCCVVVNIVIVGLFLVFLYGKISQVFLRQPSSTTDEENKSRRNRFPIGPMIIMHSSSHNRQNLSRRLESSGETADVLGKVSLVAEELDVGTVDLDLTLLALLDVLIALEGGEAPVLGDNDLLATGELCLVSIAVDVWVLGLTYLVLATPQSLESGGAVGVPRPDGHQDLANVDTSDKTVGLAESTTHTRLQSIGTSARQHLVDTDDMVGVDADTEMETFLSGNLDEVLVGANTGGFERLGRQLLVLVGDQVDAEREVVYVGLLATQVENADLGIGYTTVEPALGVLQPSQSLALAFTVFSASRTGLFLQ